MTLAPVAYLLQTPAGFTVLPASAVRAAVLFSLDGNSALFTEPFYLNQEPSAYYFVDGEGLHFETKLKAQGVAYHSLYLRAEKLATESQVADIDAFRAMLDNALAALAPKPSANVVFGLTQEDVDKFMQCDDEGAPVANTPRVSVPDEKFDGLMVNTYGNAAHLRTVADRLDSATKALENTTLTAAVTAKRRYVVKWKNAQAACKRLAQQVAHLKDVNKAQAATRLELETKIKSLERAAFQLRYPAEDKTEAEAAEKVRVFRLLTGLQKRVKTLVQTNSELSTELLELKGERVTEFTAGGQRELNSALDLKLKSYCITALEVEVKGLKAALANAHGQRNKYTDKYHALLKDIQDSLSRTKGKK